MRPLLLACALAAGAADAPAPVAIKGARIVTVSGATLESGTIVLAGGTIAAVGADVPIPAGALVIDGAGKTVYPGLIDGMTNLGLTEIGSVAGSVDVSEVGDVNPHAEAWVALHAHSDLIPVARANGLTAALVAPEGGLISGQSALIRLAGSTQQELTIRTPVAMHVNYPTGNPPSDFSRFFDEPELKTFEERQKEKSKNQRKDLDRLRNLLAEAKAYGSALDAARAGTLAPPKPDLPLAALAPAGRGRLPVLLRADSEDDIRGAVAFASEQGLKLILSGGLEAWRCAELLKQKDVPVLLKVDRLPRRESDAYDAAYGTRRRYTRPASASRSSPMTPRTRATCPTRPRWPTRSAFPPTRRCGRSRSRPPRSWVSRIGWARWRRARTRACSWPPATSSTTARR